MIVVVIIGILAAIAVPHFSQTSRSATQGEANAPLGQICTLASVAREVGQLVAACTVTTLTGFGWEAPTGGRLTYTFTGHATELGTATATPAATHGLRTTTMNCQTRTITLGTVTP